MQDLYFYIASIASIPLLAIAFLHHCPTTTMHYLMAELPSIGKNIIVSSVSVLKLSCGLCQFYLIFRLYLLEKSILYRNYFGNIYCVKRQTYENYVTTNVPFLN